MPKCLKFLLLCTCLLVPACDKKVEPAVNEKQPADQSAEVVFDNAEKKESEETYLGPLEVGMEYRYLMMASGVGRPTQRYEITYLTKGTKEIKGKTFFETHVDTGGNPVMDNFIEYDRKGEDGYYMIAHDDETQTEYLVFPRPLPTEVGASWEVTRPGKEPEPCTVLGFETVTIFGVTYEDCLKLRRESEGAVITGWLAKGLGAVKFVQDFEYGVLVFLRRPAVEDADKKTAAGDEPTAVED